MLGTATRGYAAVAPHRHGSISATLPAMADVKLSLPDEVLVARA
jgi:hypothetical protein